MLLPYKEWVQKCIMIKPIKRKITRKTKQKTNTFSSKSKTTHKKKKLGTQNSSLARTRLDPRLRVRDRTNIRMKVLITKESELVVGIQSFYKNIHVRYQLCILTTSRIMTRMN